MARCRCRPPTSLRRVGAIAEHRRMQDERPVDRGRIGIDQQFGRIEPVPLARQKRAMRAQPVTGAGRDVGDVVVKHLAGAAAQPHAPGFALTLEQAKFDRAGIGGVNRDVHPLTTERHAQGLGVAVLRCLASSIQPRNHGTTHTVTIVTRALPPGRETARRIGGPARTRTHPPPSRCPAFPPGRVPETVRRHGAVPVPGPRRRWA